MEGDNHSQAIDVLIDAISVLGVSHPAGYLLIISALKIC
jgi:hypothetical protein